MLARIPAVELNVRESDEGADSGADPHAITFWPLSFHLLQLLDRKFPARAPVRQPQCRSGERVDAALESGAVDGENLDPLPG